MMTSALRVLGMISVIAWLSDRAPAAIVLNYTFDEASFGNAPAGDFGTGVPAVGAFVGGATRTSNTPNGFSAGALDLTVAGGGTYLDGGDIDKLDNLTVFTLTAWINLQGTPSGNLRIMSKQGGGAFPGFSWNFADPITGAGTRTAANFGLRLFVGGTVGFAFDGTPTGLSIDADNKWAFIAVSYDGSSFSNNVNYYVGSVDNSATLVSTTTVSAGTVSDNTARFGVGYTDAAPAADTAPPGFLDDIRVYDGVLQPQEVELARLANIPEPSSGSLLLSALVVSAWRRRTQRAPV